MSTLSITRPICTPTDSQDRWNETRIEMHCMFCRAAVWLRNDDGRMPVCPACAKAKAEAAAHSSLAVVADLVRGCGEFADWGCDERRELLRQHGLEVEPDRNATDAPDAATRAELETRDEIEGRIELYAAEDWTMR